MNDLRWFVRRSVGVMAALSMGSLVACGGTNDGGPSTELDASATVPSGSFGTCVAPSSSSSRRISAQCAATAYGGRAIAAYANLISQSVRAIVVDTGELASSGGTLSKTLVDARISPILGTQVATADVHGVSGETTASTHIDEAVVDLAGVHITADVISSESNAHCGGAAATYQGKSQLANLRANGIKINVDSAPNQTINVLGLVKIVINEQIVDSKGLTVAALHVYALGGALASDVAVAVSRANVTCGCNTPPDAGPDGGDPDGGDPDGGDPDGGDPDGGDPDGGDPDGGPDSGLPDGGPDGGDPECLDCPNDDGGAPDSGPPGDGGKPDSGSPDGGRPGDECDLENPCGLGLVCVQTPKAPR